MLTELERVLRTKFGIPRDFIDGFISLINQDAVLTEPGFPPAVAIEDEDDLPLLAAAMSAKAAVFVTGDKELLGIRKIESVVILSPREFWEKLTTQPQRRGGRASRAAHASVSDP